MRGYSRCKVERAGAGAGTSAVAGITAGAGAAESFISTSSGMAASASAARGGTGARSVKAGSERSCGEVREWVRLLTFLNRLDPSIHTTKAD
jgi:hypothetical protein